MWPDFSIPPLRAFKQQISAALETQITNQETCLTDIVADNAELSSRRERAIGILSLHIS